MKNKIFIALALIGSLTLASCSGSRLMVTERPIVPYYQRPFAPGLGYIWIDGDWTMRGGRYIAGILGTTKRQPALAKWPLATI